MHCPPGRKTARSRNYCKAIVVMDDGDELTADEVNYIRYKVQLGYQHERFHAFINSFFGFSNVIVVLFLVTREMFDDIPVTFPFLPRKHPFPLVIIASTIFQSLFDIAAKKRVLGEPRRLAGEIKWMLQHPRQSDYDLQSARSWIDRWKREKVQSFMARDRVLNATRSTGNHGQ